MAAVGGVELNERGVSGDSPLVAGAQAELNRRRIGARGTDRTERGGDRRTIGAGGVQGQPTDYPGQQRRLDTLDEEVLAVGVVENVADQTGVEESDLDVVPVLPVHGPVPLQAMVEKFGLPADFIVRQLVGLVRAGNQVLLHRIRAVSMLRPAVLVEAARAKAL